MKIMGITGWLASTALFAACGSVEGGTTLTYSSQSEALTGAICGGIAGFQCPEGQKCLIKESYPDAAGVCVGSNGHGNPNANCEAVKCAACPEGFRHHPNNSCCGVCTPDNGNNGNNGNNAGEPDGSCTTPVDCEGLIHIMCVGDWACLSGICAYQCAGEPIAL